MYVSIAENEGSDIIEVPTEDDETILLSTLNTNFPEVTGLKYRVDGHVRIIKLKDGKLYPPEFGWGTEVYHCVIPKGIKRKAEEDEGETPGAEWVSTDLVVLGLAWKTTDKELSDYFSQYGKLAMAQVKVDPVTKKSKGYGFIRFVDKEAQVRVMLQRHEVDGRFCDVRIPISRDTLVKKSPSKIFVGQCTEAMTEDILREHFEKYGAISDLYIPKPFRGFAFVTYTDSNAVKSVCNDDHTILNAKVHVTEAIPKGESSKFERSRPGTKSRGGDGGPGNAKARASRAGGGGSGYYDERGGGGGGYDDYYDDYDRKQRNPWSRSGGSGGGGGGHPPYWNEDPWRPPPMPAYNRPSVRSSNFDDNYVANAVNKAVMGAIGNLKEERQQQPSDNNSYSKSDWWTRR